MTLPSVWFLENDAYVAYRFGKLLLRNAILGVQNWKDLAGADYTLRNSRASAVDPDNVPLPSDFPPLRLALPENGFSPDYFSFGSCEFCSQRLRDAMALPDGVVQYAPVDLVLGGNTACAQDYRLLRVLAIQPAMDLERSECEVEDCINIRTGEHFKWPTAIERFILLDDLQPMTEIFRVAEIDSRVLVTDALAERVLRAGCTGIEFSDPANPQSGHRIVRYRTANGVAEREV